MDAWQRSVHVDTLRVMRAAGIGAEPLGGQCCGALHGHAGLPATSLVEDVMASVADGRPVLVNSAGCGAQLKNAGEILDTDEAREFASRVFDVHEYILANGAKLTALKPSTERIAIQDPCHLRHLQRSEAAVFELLQPLVEVSQLDDKGLCCGAGGAFSLVHREMALSIRDRKSAAIERSGATLVVSANPGCSMHLTGGGHKVVHPMTLLAEIVCPKEIT